MRGSGRRLDRSQPHFDLHDVHSHCNDAGIPRPRFGESFDTSEFDETFGDIMNKLDASKKSLALEQDRSKTEIHRRGDQRLQNFQSEWAHGVYDFFPGADCGGQRQTRFPRSEPIPSRFFVIDRDAAVDVELQPCLRKPKQQCCCTEHEKCRMCRMHPSPWNYDARGNATLGYFRRERPLQHLDLTPSEQEQAVTPERSWSTSSRVCSSSHRRTAFRSCTDILSSSSRTPTRKVAKRSASAADDIGRQEDFSLQQMHSKRVSASRPDLSTDGEVLQHVPLDLQDLRHYHQYLVDELRATNKRIRGTQVPRVTHRGQSC